MDFQQLLAALLAMIERSQGGVPGNLGSGGAEAGNLQPVPYGQTGLDPATVAWGSGVNVAPAPPAAAPVDPATVMFGGGVNVASPAVLSGNPDAPSDAIWGPPSDPYARFQHPAARPMHPAGQPAATGPVPRFGQIPAKGPQVPIRGGAWAPDSGFMDAALAFMRNQARFRPPYRVGGHY